MKSQLVRALLLCLVFSASLWAQWPTDSTVNLSIADRVSEQVIPKVAATADGGCYVGWFDLASGNYDVYLQRLDNQGIEQWAHNGILISNNPQNSWLVDWDLIVDSSDHCVLVFADDRNGGGDFDIYAYRIAPDGTMVWGANGVTLSDDPGFEPAPRVAALSNGNFAFVWARDSNGKIMAQVLDPAGVPQFAVGGMPIGGLAGESPGFCELAASDSGSFIVAWVRDISTFMSDRHIHARKVSAAGTPAWSLVHVFDANSVPIAHAPTVLSDGAGGAIICWHEAPVSMFNSRVQHLDASGVELFPHNGITVSTNTTRNHLDPCVTYDTTTQEITVFFNERNSGQSQWGIYGQKFDALGNRAWGPEGVTLISVSTIWRGPPRCVSSSSGAMVFLIDEPTGSMSSDRVIGMHVDGNGAGLWAGQPIEVASFLSGKSRLPVAGTPQGAAILVWEDERIDAADVYGQLVNEDGTFGGVPIILDEFIRGDCNNDGSYNIADPIALLAYLFPSAPPPTPLDCDDACDCNDDEALDISDAIRMLNGLFGTTITPPEPPHPSCGIDPAGDDLDCAVYSHCP